MESAIREGLTRSRIWADTPVFDSADGSLRTVSERSAPLKVAGRGSGRRLFCPGIEGSSVMSVINKVYETNGPEETMRTGRMLGESAAPGPGLCPGRRSGSRQNGLHQRVCRGIWGLKNWSTAPHLPFCRFMRRASSPCIILMFSGSKSPG